MTIAAYQTLYESSVAFGMRKALQAEQGKADMEKKVTFIVKFKTICMQIITTQYIFNLEMPSQAFRFEICYL